MWILIGMLVIGLLLYVPITMSTSNYYKKQLQNYNLSNDNIKIHIGNRDTGTIFIYSRDKRLFYGYPIGNQFNEINIKDILKIEMETKYEYEGKQKVVSLTPQSTITGKEIGVTLRIITEDNVYNVFVSTNKKNDAIRLKTLLEKEIEENN